jgi:putative PIN family toxin of toxin-antitoxin system
LKVFLDTNVLVSAVTTRGLCADVLREVLTSKDLVVSEQVLDEVRRVLARKFGADAETVAEFIALLRQTAVVAAPPGQFEVKLADRDDIPILAAAVVAHADVLVTGDAELLALGAVGGTTLMSPRQYWEAVKAKPHRRPGRSKG